MKEVIEDQILIERAKLDHLSEEHRFLSGRADRLLSASLDEDLLEERVRGVLGLVDRGEYLVRMDDLDRLASLPVRNDALDDGVRYASVGSPAQ